MPNVLIVNSIGPQGPVGPQGPTGPSGSVSTGSFVTTSSFNTFTGSYNTGSFTGSFAGSGVGLYNIPASGITGLNLSQIASGSYSASISPANGFTVNTNANISGALTASSAIISGNVTVQGTASINTLVVNQTVLSTGSNQLGDAVNDTQTLYGSVIIPTGSLTITGSLTVQTLGNTTQITSVVQAGTGSLALVPSGSGAIVASIPDGTATGGNARGTYVVDLQTSRTANTNVASANSATISGGSDNQATGAYGTVIGGRINKANANTAVAGGDNSNVTGTTSIGIGSDLIVSGNYAVAFGRTNTVSSQYSGVLAGQSNTASTNTHATVVGGQSNTASGAQSIAGGLSSVASGANSVALGYKATATATGAIVIAANDGAGTPQASGNWSMVLGGVMSTATTSYATTLGGYRNTASGFASYALGYRSEAYLRGQLSIGEYFVTTGDAQQSLLTARNSAALSTGGTLVLYLDGSSATSTLIPNGTNRVWHTVVDTVAVVTTISGSATGVTVGDSFMQTDKLLFKKVGGTSSVVGRSTTETIYDTSMSTAAMLFATGSSQELAITFQAPTFSGGGSITCRVVSKVSLVEVAY